MDRLQSLPLIECSAGTLTSRALNLSERSIEFIASTEALDSHGTIVVQDWDLSRYLRNPVVLLEHGRAVGGMLSGSGERDIDKLPIARSENVRVENGALRMRVVFPAAGRDERSDAVWRAIEDGRLNAVSVGFLPGAMSEEEIEMKDANGVPMLGDDGKPVTKTVTRISNNMLYELSVVGLPSNPEAVAVRALSVRTKASALLHDKTGILVDAMLQTSNTPKQAAPVDLDAFFARPEIREALSSLRTMAKPSPVVEPEEVVAADADGPVSTDDRAAVPYEAHPPVEGAWDGAAAKDRVAKWASSDGSGAEDKINWAKYRSAFAWFDSSSPNAKGSYSLPHHDVQDGKLVTVKAGVVAAGNAMQGARGGVTKIPDGDRPGVKAHLAKHYAQFGMTPPWESKVKSMDPELFSKCLAALGLEAEATPDMLLLSLKALSDSVNELSKDSVVLGNIAELLDLSATADEAAMTKAIVHLHEKKDDKVVAMRVIALETSLEGALEREANREVSWILAAGEKGIYGLGKGQSMKALKAYRSLSPADFAEEYKAALDGLNAFDDPGLFVLKTVSTVASPAAASAGPTDLAARPIMVDVEDHTRALSERVETFVKKEAEAGRKVSVTEAFDLVARGRDLLPR